MLPGLLPLLILVIDSPATQVNSPLRGPPDVTQAIEVCLCSTFRCSTPQSLEVWVWYVYNLLGNVRYVEIWMFFNSVYNTDYIDLFLIQAFKVGNKV